MELSSVTYVPLQAVVGMQLNHGIGKNNDLLVKSRGDLRRFKELTDGGVLILGSRTLKSLPNGALSNRAHIVLTREENVGQHPDDDDSCPTIPVNSVYEAIAEALAFYESGFDKGIFVIGGGQIYEAFLPYCTDVIMTRFPNVVADPDTFFPALKDRKEWSIEKFDTVSGPHGPEQLIHWKNGQVLDYREDERYKEELEVTMAAMASVKIESASFLDMGVLYKTRQIVEPIANVPSFNLPVDDDPVYAIFNNGGDILSLMYKRDIKFPKELYSDLYQGERDVTLNNLAQAFYYGAALFYADFYAAEKIRSVDNYEMMVKIITGLKDFSLTSFTFIAPRLLFVLLEHVIATDKDFESALLETQSKILLATGGFDNVMGTGLGLKSLNELRKPAFWPGNNQFGGILAVVRELAVRRRDKPQT